MANTKMVRKFKSLSKPPIVVYVSGSLMYGNQSSGFALESSSLRPEAFGRYYYKAEEPWIQAQMNDSLDVRFARPGWVVGPSSWFKAFFWNYIKANKMVPIHGTGKQLMSLVHIDDCARLIEALSKYGARGQNLNVFGCKPITQEEFSELLSSITGLPIKRLTFEETGKMYGTTATHALVSSTPMDTLYPEIHQAAQIKHDSPKKILSSIIGLLENEQGVFSKTPKDGFAN
jgi:nucleoside-diphosphate-sugar epimerase